MILTFGGRKFCWNSSRQNLTDNILVNAQTCQSTSNNNYVSIVTSQMELPWCVVTMKCFPTRAGKEYLVIDYSHLMWKHRVEHLWWNTEAICTLGVSIVIISLTLWVQPEQILIIYYIIQYSQLCMAHPIFIPCTRIGCGHVGYYIIAN